MSEILSNISSAVISGNKDGIAEMTNRALAENIDAQNVLNDGLMPGMDYVGVEFKAGRMFVPEVLRSARAMQASMELLRPLLAETGAASTGRILLGTVQGDMHDIGKNLVGMMCEGAGFEVIDLGKNISPDGFVSAVVELKPQIVGMSALLTTTMGAMAQTIRALDDAGLRDQVKIMVGGAPLTQNFADQIGADGFASNAVAAAEMAQAFLRGS